MTPTSHTGNPPPSLPDLLAGYLQRQALAQADGLGSPDSGEVVPFEAAPVQPVDARLAWTEALVALHFFARPAQTERLSAPPDWPALVTGREPVLALAFAVGHFPQLLRDFQPLLHSPAHERRSESRPLAVASLVDWVENIAKKKSFPELLLGIGCLRLACHFDKAEEIVRTLGPAVPADWKPAWANEQAALAWHRGRTEEAAASWSGQHDSVPVQFNRGMAALFLGQADQARTHLAAAVAGLPEDSGWHHLGRLYLTLAEQ
jgi:hypothetical protein